MSNYYKVLNVPADANSADIKSAFRRLARKKHPDVNDGDRKASREFARIAKAYRVLSDPQKRAAYDKVRLKNKYGKGGSVFDADNPHARRARQMAYERRYNAIIDRMIADERREAMALQQVIFPVVALFISTGFVAVFKPQFWSNSNVLGKIALLTFFAVGLLHMSKRLWNGLERYTYTRSEIHDSVLREIEEETRPYPRVAAIIFLFGGVLISLGAGLIIGSFLEVRNTSMIPRMLVESLRYEFVFYPPIVVLVVDMMHSFATRFER